jgi:hypothetical protein
MKLILTIIARLALVLTVVPAFLHLFGMLSADAVKWIMLAATVAWFIAAPLLQREHEKGDDLESRHDAV